MTTTGPLLVRTRPGTELLPAMQLPELDDSADLERFVAWADQHGLLLAATGDQPMIIDQSGYERPVQPTWWVLVHTHQGFGGDAWIEMCAPDYFAEVFEPARPLRVETWQSADDLHRWRVVHTSNGETMASGEGYTDPRDRDHAIQVLFPDLEVEQQEQP